MRHFHTHFSPFWGAKPALSVPQTRHLATQQQYNDNLMNIKCLHNNEQMTLNFYTNRQHGYNADKILLADFPTSCKTHNTK